MKNNYSPQTSKFSSTGLGMFGLLANLTLSLLTPITMHAQTPAHEILKLERPLVIAHRGYSMIAPENTLAAFKLAKVAHADLVELDYYVSKDGVAMVFHDKTLDRTSNAIAAWGKEGLKVSDVTANALQKLDVGAWFSDHFTGERMPTLEESLDVIQADGGMTLIERKEGSAEQLAKLLASRSLLNQLVVQAFDWQFLKELNVLLPDQVLGALGPVREHNGRAIPSAERALSSYWIDEVLKSGVKVIGWNRQVSAEAVAYAHSKGLKVFVYTINDIELATSLIEMGVDGIISDNTSIVWRTIALRAHRGGN